MGDLGAAATAAMTRLVGEAGVADDGAIMIAQIERALHILEAPAIAQGALFGLEPSSHAATLVRLAPERAR